MDTIKARKLVSIFKFLLISCLCSSFFWGDKKFKVLIENGEEPQMRGLPNLDSSSKFDGDYFRIVEGRDENPISFKNENDALVLKAATVYYHFEIARKFFKDNFESDFINVHPKITIRIDIKNKFNKLTHFEPDWPDRSDDEVYNQAYTIPGTKEDGVHDIMIGEENELGEVIKPWDPETWYHPMKVEQVPVQFDVNTQAVAQVFGIFKDRTHDITFKQFLMVIVSPGSISENFEYIMRTPLIQSAIAESAYQGLHTYVALFRQTADYYVDAAMIPEVSYHEYVHHVLSDYLPTETRNPVVEGFANYFAARILGSKELGHNSDYSNAREKHADREIFYERKLELENNSHLDFVMTLLWDIRETLIASGKTSKEVDQLIFDSRKMLDAESNIEVDLTAALINTCQKVDYCDEADQVLMLTAFSYRGLY
ncbi:MAG: hypothetical protein H6622_13175 [Halobacteriovoraceae bacterium]|nr:hypothetical protein [Halobacteriovoraceae bacterium]